MNHCLKPFLPNYLLFDEDCTSKTPGDVCKLICKRGGMFIADNYIRCLQPLMWTSYPLCTCPNPILKYGMHTIGNCKYKFPGETCSVKCQDNLKLEGKKRILCQNDTKWSEGPQCKVKLCPKHSLPSHLLLKENCSSKSVNERCELICKHGGERKHNRFIECYSNTKWSEFPTCFCSLPVLNKELKFREACFNKSEGEKCFLKCKTKQKDPDKIFVRCLRGGLWTVLPSCSNRVCYKPKPSNYIVIADNCSKKLVNEICKINCKSPIISAGKDFIICQKNYRWSQFPPCIERMCPKLILNKKNLNFKGNCSRKIGSDCQLICAENFTLDGRSRVICLNNTSWSPLPKCKPILYCPEPNIDSSILKLKGNCNLKRSGEICEISCREGGKIIGHNIIECRNNLTWSSLPICTCPKPSLFRNLVVLENCINKRGGENCTIGCKPNFNFKGDPFLKCKNNTRWSLKAKCIAQCTKPVLPVYLVFKGNCSSKSLGDRCVVNCQEKGKTIGHSSIKCIGSKKWSPLPDCTCPPPYISADMEAKEKCSFKKRGGSCEVGCKKIVD
ncbi:P-selectin-like [Parasteatoda tepidariorum]|uniref:P-selectin-like n=1 Tax=Parasteatoda tepidariorum TaxID=114398 RepID=UPI0039BC60EC